MRRVLALLTVCLILSCVIAVPAEAASVASKIDVNCSVLPEGDCMVTLNATVLLEGNYPDLTFPLPVNAKNITMNGASVSTTRTGTATLVDISKLTRGYQGEISMRFEYTLTDVVKAVDVLDIKGKPTGDRTRQLQLPMLSGFEFPVGQLSFVVNMPAGTMTHRPDFKSTSRQASFASDLELLPITGNQIIGSSKVRLNDHESVEMTMYVPEEMFPSVSIELREGNPEVIPMLICAGLALLYWLLFLRTRPLIPSRTSTPPEGITAGELGCRLTLAGGDLTSMVFSWAQLGYLLISLDNGQVHLHKRMDMGNERSLFENKIYKQLFGNRRVVDATGYGYAKLCRKVAGIVPNERNMHKNSSGSKKIYRGLCCGSQIFCGICVAMNMTANPILQVMLSIILGALGAVTGWLILGIAPRTHLRGKTPVKIGLVCILIWVVLGFLCGQVLIPTLCSLGMTLMGYPAAYGGRRSELGRHDAGQVLGLRHYLKKLPKEDLGRLLGNDPDYFFHLAPYALALGILNPFSKRFGQRKFNCPYIVTRVTGRRTAQEWADIIIEVADMMDAKERRMQIDRWIALQPPPPPAPRRRPANRKR